MLRTSCESRLKIMTRWMDGGGEFVPPPQGESSSGGRKQMSKKQDRFIVEVHQVGVFVQKM